MKDEIKEILKIRSVEQQAIDNLKTIISCDNKIIEIEPPLEDTAQILLDYITNLQEENKKLKGLVNPTTQIFIDTQDMEERYGQELYEDYLKEQLEVYKSRIEQAIEYIENPRHEMSVLTYQNLLSILQGVGKDE